MDCLCNLRSAVQVDSLLQVMQESVQSTIVTLHYCMDTVYLRDIVQLRFRNLVSLASLMCLLSMKGEKIVAFPLLSQSKHSK